MRSTGSLYFQGLCTTPFVVTFILRDCLAFCTLLLAELFVDLLTPLGFHFHIVNQFSLCFKCCILSSVYLLLHLRLVLLKEFFKGIVELLSEFLLLKLHFAIIPFEYSFCGFERCICSIVLSYSLRLPNCINGPLDSSRSGRQRRTHRESWTQEVLPSLFRGLCPNLCVFVKSVLRRICTGYPPTAFLTWPLRRQTWPIDQVPRGVECVQIHVR